MYFIIYKYIRNNTEKIRKKMNYFFLNIGGYHFPEKQPRNGLRPHPKNPKIFGRFHEVIRGMILLKMDKSIQQITYSYSS